MNVFPITPVYDATVTLSATTTSSNSNVTGSGNLLKITNAGSDLVFIKIGTSTQTATSDDFPLISGESVYISKPSGTVNVAAIAASTTATVYVSPLYGG